MKKFEEHIDFSIKRIGEFKSLIKNSTEINSRKDFCMYSTGSYGRSEAGQYSDLDLFFIYENEKDIFPKITKTLIDSDIIKACREMNLPEFSGDGEYLEIHNVKEICRELGSRNDDYLNLFTARMLLLLESKPLYNEELYEKVVNEVVQKYYGDFHTHEKDFAPVFLVNDVIRFWRTLCLNYEHNRNRKVDENDSELEKSRKRNKAHIKNLKLKFSRKLTCFSFLLSVLYSKDILNSERVLEIVKLSPLERLNAVSKSNPKTVDGIEKIFDLYNWFLDLTHKSENELLEWINEQNNRDIAFSKSREFAKLFFELMINEDNKEKLLYFLI